MLQDEPGGPEGLVGWKRKGETNRRPLLAEMVSPLFRLKVFGRYNYLYCDKKKCDLKRQHVEVGYSICRKSP